jgi:hypothetical protein
VSADAPVSERRGRLFRVAAVMVVTLVILAGIFLFTLQTNATNVSTAAQVHDLFAAHLTDFTSANATRATSDYASGATLVWTGDGRNWVGTYVGSTAIHAFFSRYFSVYRTDSMHAVVYSVQAVGNGATVNGSVQLIGLSISNQSMSASILTQATYSHANGAWVISRETWTFLNFNILPPLD